MKFDIVEIIDNEDQTATLIVDMDMEYIKVLAGMKLREILLEAANTAIVLNKSGSTEDNKGEN